MSTYAVMNALMTSGLTPNESKVYAYLVGRANGAKVCWPTVDDIAADLNMSRRAVIDATTTLQGRPADPDKKIEARPQLIEVRRRYRQSNNYVVVDVPGLHDRPIYSGSKRGSVYSWPDEETQAEDHSEPGVQNPAHVSPEPTVQISAHVPETPPLECKIPHSEVQITAPESVQQESIKKEKEDTSLRSVARARRTSAKHAIPDDWQPRLQAIELASQLGLNIERVAEEAERMRDWAIFNDVQGKDWDRRFHNWLREEARRDDSRPGRSQRGRRQDLSKFEIIHAENGTTSLWATMNDDSSAIEVDRPRLSIVGGRAP